MVPEGGQPPDPDAPPESSAAWDETATPMDAPPPAEEAPPGAPIHGAHTPGATTPVAPVPPVAWGPPPAPVAIAGIGSYQNGTPPFTVGALLKDAFARYAADPFRLFTLGALASLVTYGLLAVSNPYDPRTAPAAGGYSLLGTLLSLAFTAMTLALLEGGPSMPAGRAIGRGLQRTGWLILQLLLLGVLLVVVAVLAVLVLGILAFVAAPVAVILAIVLVPVFVWLVFRLALAIPAVVVDSLGPIEGLQLSWRITRPAGVWLRILGSALLLGLLLGPVEFGSFFLARAVYGGRPELLVPAGLLVAVFAPLGSALTYSAYRRLVPPFWPPWTGLPAAAPGTSPADVAPPTFSAPVLGGGAQALLAVLVVAAILGLVAGSWVLGEIGAGRIDIPSPVYPGFSFPPFPTFGP